MIATDAQGKPVVLTHHRVERGANDRDGQWAVVCVERTLTDDGAVASVRRTICGWHAYEQAAAADASSRDGRPT